MAKLRSESKRVAEQRNRKKLQKCGECVVRIEKLSVESN